MNERRSKRKSRDNIKPSPENASNLATRTDVKIEEELQKAMDTVLVTRDRAKKLHSLWRNHLWKLSFLVSFISMYQTQEPFKICILNMKNGVESLASHPILYLLGENLCEVVNMIISFLLFNFLSLDNPNGSLTVWQFLTASTLVPVCLGLFYNSNPIGCRNNDFPNHDELHKRQCPVSVIFHFIVAGCYSFMKMGMDRYENNVDMVKDLQTELSISRKKHPQNGLDNRCVS
jgi:hypothetical protein